ncbi:YdcF family protein [Hwanghaeella sp. 1Z406]|uniref:YdcF family protein n=1 Tax=Hwanghaeella sp. 1Z406 TaxID=3402811 RepID=UPI003B678594|tara:strand:- start:8837 stop:9679 length:843 start_codon:yes stop_codon:yes gene_type:complete
MIQFLTKQDAKIRKTVHRLLAARAPSNPTPTPISPATSVSSDGASPAASDTPPEKSAQPRHKSMGPDGLAMLLISSVVIFLTVGLSLLVCLIHVLRKAWLASSNLTPTLQADRSLIVVLGVCLNADGSLPDDYILRLRRAITLNILPILILGGATRGPHFPTESQAGRDWLLAQHLAGDTILCEDGSRSTLENLTYLRSALAPGTDRPVMITNRYHIARLQIMARGLGLNYPLCAAEDEIPWSLSQCGKLLLEAAYIHWYYTGYWIARLLRHKGMLARIS